MNTKAKEKQDTRTALLQTGMDLMMERGYTNTGINDILGKLGVPKGSFYHYFESKENYAVDIIRFFDASYSESLIQTLRNPQETPLTRLKTYCEQHRDMLASRNCRKGCLIGNLSQEMADQSEVLRTELCLVMNKWRDIIAACIEEGQTINEIKRNRPAHEYAELFSAGWSGAMMRAKTVKCTDPIETFIDLMFNDVLKS